MGGCVGGDKVKLKQVLDMLNKVKVISSDYNGEVILYVLADKKEVKMICLEFGIDYYKIYEDYDAAMRLEDNETDMLPVIDALNSKYSVEIWHDEKKGFYLAMDRVNEITHSIMAQIGQFKVSLNRNDFERCHKELTCVETRVKKLRELLDVWG